MNKFLSLLMIATVAIFSSCSDGEKSNMDENGYTLLESGLKYKIITKGDGLKADNGMNVSVHYIGTLLDGTEFDSSVKRGQPFAFKLGIGQVIKGWDEGIALLNVGDSASFLIPDSLAYGSVDRPGIPANSTLNFEVKLVDAKAPVVIEKYKVEGLDTLVTNSGLKYIILEEGEGENPKAQDVVSVHYSGYLTDGTMFDSSVKADRQFDFELGIGRVIPGWDEGIAMMKPGAKFQLLIPYHLAYGEKGYPGHIPEKADLIFDVELLSVKAPLVIEKYNVKGLKVNKTESGLKYIVLEEGTGENPLAQNVVSVHYTGYFADGTMFDSSIKRGQPIEFPLGAGRVIKGWDEGIALMKKGARYQLIIPYQLAYGEAGRPGGIPPKAELTFDVELVNIKAQ